MYSNIPGVVASANQFMVSVVT